VSEVKDVYTIRLPVSISKTQREVKFNPKTVRLDLLGSRSFIAEMKNEQIQILLDIGTLRPGIYELTPRVVIDPKIQKNISVKDLIPPRIHVRIS